MRDAAHALHVGLQASAHVGRQSSRHPALVIDHHRGASVRGTNGGQLKLQGAQTGNLQMLMDGDRFIPQLKGEYVN